jgi:hypothetical protein
MKARVSLFHYHRDEPHSQSLFCADLRLPQQTHIRKENVDV